MNDSRTPFNTRICKGNACETVFSRSKIEHASFRSRVNNSCSSLSHRWVFALLRAVCFCCLTTNAWASSRDARAIADQLPKRHAIMRVVTGNLNMDGRPDALVIARSWDESTNGDTPRPLLMFLRQPNGNLKRVARADGVIACRNCGGLVGDPWRRDHTYPAFVSIQRGAFSVAEFAGSGWRGWTVKTFRYDPGVARWFLESCRNKVYHVDHIFPVELNTASKRDFGSVLLEQFSINRGCWS